MLKTQICYTEKKRYNICIKIEFYIRINGLKKYAVVRFNIYKDDKTILNMYYFRFLNLFEFVKQKD
jgi:hypothetical protein